MTTTAMLGGTGPSAGPEENRCLTGKELARDPRIMRAIALLRPNVRTRQKRRTPMHRISEASFAR